MATVAAEIPESTYLVSRLEVENFQRIITVDLALGEGVTEISGRNGAGKTSTLNAIHTWIDGLAVAPAEPIRKGAERARIRGRLGEMYVTREIAHKKGGGYTTRLLFEPVEGKPYPATQRQLHDLIGEHQLDPLDFIALDKKGKFDALRTFVPGFDFSKAAREHAADFTRRTDVNRLAREARAAASLIVIPEGTPEDPIDEQALVEQLQKAGVSNADLEARKLRREQAAQNVEQLRKQAQEVLGTIEQAAQAARTRHAQLIEESEQRIRDLERQIAAIRARIASSTEQLESDIARETERYKTQAAEHTAAADALQKRLDEAPELPALIDTQELSQQIEQARKTNQAVSRRVERRRHEQLAERYETESKDLTEAMEARQRAKEDAIASAQLPVEGIEFAEDEILLHGVPFDQASTAQKLRVALGLIVARNPKLRLAWVRDASLLDDATYAEIQKLAAEYRCAVLLETVRPIGQNVVSIEDGRTAAAQQSGEVAA